MPQKIIIIGATSGIGREMALQYLAEGCMVGITGRRQHLLQELQQLYPKQVHTRCFDVAQKESKKFVQELIDEMQGLNLLVYNAGYGDVDDQLNCALEATITQTNVTGFIEIVCFAFNYFAAKSGGQIGVISSIAALRGNSWAPAYSASKAFISNYAEGLNMKARKLRLNIVVTDIKPGFINTKTPKVDRRFWVATTHIAAAQIRTAIKKKKRVAYITRRWWAVAQIMRVLPYNVYKRLA